MSYAVETILTLKEPRSTEEQPFAYDRVKVIGPSPINHSSVQSEWTGAEGQGVIITPLTDFGATLDRPYGELRDLYDVESIPDTTRAAAPTIRVYDATSGEAGPTPEEVFKDAARNDPAPVREDGQVRARTPLNPLAETEEEAAARKAEADERAAAIRENVTGS